MRSARRSGKNEERGKPKSGPARNAPSAVPLPSLSGASNAIRTRLAKLGIARSFDLVLHLPLRYDDETRLYPIGSAPPGTAVLVEGKVIECDVKYRPRRQLVCHMADGSGVLTLRFFHFYTSQQKQLAAGTRIRAFGEIRHGFFGAEMVHPRYSVVRDGAPVPQSLTPVYSTTAGLNQDALRRLIGRALAEGDLGDTLPATLLAPLKNDRQINPAARSPRRARAPGAGVEHVPDCA